LFPRQKGGVKFSYATFRRHQRLEKLLLHFKMNTVTPFLPSFCQQLEQALFCVRTFSFFRFLRLKGGACFLLSEESFCF
jgi:hypothetical protein